MQITSLGTALGYSRLGDGARIDAVPRVRRRDGGHHDVPRAEPTGQPPVAGGDEVQISGEAEEAAEEQEKQEAAANREAKATREGELSKEEQQQVQELKSRDREVRQHEHAHLAAAGPYARGGPTYTYERGPDGGQYAVGGEVQIDTAPVAGDPEATIAKARVIRRAALAPAEPSSTDRAVAAQATQMESAARQEILKEAATSENEPTDEVDETESTIRVAGAPIEDDDSREGDHSEQTEDESSAIGRLLDLVG